MLNGKMIMIGEIYRVPGTNQQLSTQRFDEILQNISDFRGDVMIGTDQNFNSIEIEKHSNTKELLDVFISHAYFSTISVPTKITHKSTTLINNIYVKCDQLDNLVSGTISVYISDHLPVFTFIERATQINSRPVKITCRPINDVNLANNILIYESSFRYS